MASKDAICKIWKYADAVTLDVDSTVCVDEGIDELAIFLGKGQEVARLTDGAMAGSMSFHESLTKRLDIMKPRRDEVEVFVQKHPPQLSNGVAELVSRLHGRMVPVYLISGGFREIIRPVAMVLGIPEENIFANEFRFTPEGQYVGFDESQPTCQQGGKSKVIKELKQEEGYQRLVHVGDGVTDMEACPPADAFIGFGGNKVREKVRNGSRWFVGSFQELLDIL